MQADRDGDGVFDDLEARVRDVPGTKNLRVLVSLSANATKRRTGRLENEVGSLDVTDRFSVVDGFAAVVDAGQVRELANEPGVEHVELDGKVHATNASAQTSFGVTDARADMPALDGGDGIAAYSKDDMVAAVIDTGIGTPTPGQEHANLNNNKVIAFRDFTDGNPNDVDLAYDNNGHGTHVSGTIAGDGVPGGEGSMGVAPAAALVGLKVLGANGSGLDSDVLAAIQWVIDNGDDFGIEAINLSLGGEGCSNGSDLGSQAVNSAFDLGYVVAVAAGNDGPAGCSASTGISSPAAAANAITVGAMADLGQSGFYLVGFSSRGPTLDGRTKPDISSPGVFITSADNATTGDVVLSGTSMAIPFVVGVSLLMRDLNSALSPAQVKTRIMQTAVDWGPAGTDNDYGAGRIDAYAAIAAAAAVPGAPLDDDDTAVPAYEKETGPLTATGDRRLYTVTAQGGFPMTLGLTVDDGANDFDMYLYDASGVQVASAITPFRQDELHLSSASNGPYTLRVESFKGAGSYALDVSGGSAAELLPLIEKPTNQSPPSVSGTVASGQTLTGDRGTWTGPDQISYAYRWERCNFDASSCEDTTDDDLTHAVEAADLGKRLRLRVAATNPGGTTVARSALTDVVTPTNSSAPVVSGTTTEGNVLQATNGTWNGTDPVSFTHAWQSCAADGSGCAAIAGATAVQYQLTTAEVGRRVQVAVTGTNSAGTATATSALTAVVSGVAPSNTERPAVTGSAVQGAVLSSTNGAWSGTQPITFTRQWYRCDSALLSCSPLAGATGTTYSPTDADVGFPLRVSVTATNMAGSASSDSLATASVSPAPPSPPSNTRLPSLSGQTRDGFTLTLSSGRWNEPARSSSATAGALQHGGRRVPGDHRSHVAALRPVLLRCGPPDPGAGPGVERRRRGTGEHLCDRGGEVHGADASLTAASAGARG